MRLDATQHLPRLFFTELGLLALRTMMADGRLANPEKFAHVRRELGLEPDPDATPAEDAVERQSGGLPATNGGPLHPAVAMGSGTLLDQGGYLARPASCLGV